MENDSDPGLSGRAKRSGPTIDLDPAQVTVNESATAATGSAAQDPSSDMAEPVNDQADRQEHARDQPGWGSSRRTWSDNASNALTPALSGATAAALILVGAWLLGLSGDNRTPPAAPATESTTTADLGVRLAQLEAKMAAALSAPAAVTAADPALARRIDQTEASVRSTTAAVTALRADVDKALTSAKDISPSQRDAQTLTFDPAPLEQRLSQIETTQLALTQALQQARPYDDTLLRRSQIATALDSAVRAGEPFADILAAAKKIAPTPSLQPLEAFAAAGVPNDAVLSRELIASLPQLSPVQPKQAAVTSNAGSVLDRLQESAARLVKVERADQANTGQSVSTASVAAAARNGDVNAAKAALLDLPAPQRAAAQGWLDRLQARNAAREAARQFAAAQIVALPATAR